MKFTFKSNPELDDNEIIIEHNTDSELIDELHKFLMNQQKSYASLKLYSRDEQVFLKVSDILFFETSDNIVYAHTLHEAYESSYRLYELEELLPSYFVRISKSTICNVNTIRSISRTLSSSGSVKFNNSPKEVYVSRMYFSNLKQHLEKRINL